MSENDQGLPPLPTDIERDLGALGAVKPRTPAYQFITIIVLSLVFAGVVVALVSLRQNLALVPPLFWMACGIALLVGFTLPLYLAVVPPKGSMFPRQRLATVVAIVAAFAIVGLSLITAVTGGDPMAALANCHGCLRISALVALVPVALVCFVLRHSFIRVSRLFAASLGMSAGCLGFTAIELCCANPDLWHILFTHVGIIGVAGVLAALIIPRSVEI